MTKLLWTEKGAALNSDGGVLTLTSATGETRTVGDVLLDAASVLKTRDPDRGEVLSAPPDQAQIAALAGPIADGVDDVAVFFVARKFGLPEAFVEVLRCRDVLWLVTGPKPAYWYVLEQLRHVVVRCPSAAAAEGIVDELRSILAPEPLTSTSGTYVHEVLNGHDDNGFARFVGATWVGEQFTVLGEHAALTAQPTLEQHACSDQRDAARRAGSWLLRQLADGKPLATLALNDGFLALPKADVVRLTKELKPAKKAKATPRGT